MANQKRVVVITGGGTGMGKAAAHKFAELGDTVYILGRRKEKLEEAAKGFDGIYPVVCDVTDSTSIQYAVEEITSKHSTIDVLVNNAGGSAKTKYDDPTFEQASAMWQEVIATNFTSVFLVTHAFIPHLKDGSGRVINITSIAALAGSTNPGVTNQAYSASKAGVHGLSRTLVNLLSPRGITVNCVAPGLIGDTNFFGDNVPEDLANKYLSKIPLKRLGTPEDIATGIVYLASPEAAYITGEILNINGGALFGR